MALTPQELEQWVNSKIDTSVEPNWVDQNDISQYRGIGIKYDKQLQDLDTLYSSKINKLIDNYERELTVFSSYIKNFNIAPIELKGNLGGLSTKILRLGEKWLATKREIEGRTKGYFTRNPVGTVYYIDLDNGSDASPHDGLKVGNYTADVGTGETTLIEDAELGRTTDDDWNGAYLYNVTRGIGVLITDSAYVAGTWTLTHPTITGQVSGDTYFIIDAWKTLEQYTIVTERSPGDIAYVRANTDEIPVASVQFDENGSYLNGYIKIIGCDSVVNDPWSDSSDVKPQIDFNANVYWVNFSTDILWWLERLVVENSSTDGMRITGNACALNYFKLCEFNSNGADGAEIGHSGYQTFDSCGFTGNTGHGIGLMYACILAKSCTFDDNTDGIAMVRAGYCEAIDCNYGQTIANSSDDVSLTQGAVYLDRNCKYNTGINAAYDVLGAQCEDHDGVKGAHKMYLGVGTITKDTSVVRSGGADSSAKMEPTAYCGTIVPLSLRGGHIHSLFEPFKIWCKGEAERTITIYIRSLGAWGTYPTASELYVEASYLDHVTNASRTTIVSNDVLDDETTWRAFDVTFTPLQEGFVYLNVYLKLYESGKGIYCDIKPVVS